MGSTAWGFEPLSRRARTAAYPPSSSAAATAATAATRPSRRVSNGYNDTNCSKKSAVTKRAPRSRVPSRAEVRRARIAMWRGTVRERAIPQSPARATAARLLMTRELSRRKRPRHLFRAFSSKKQGGVHCCLSRCNSGRFFVPMRGGFPAFLLAGARCLRAALSGEAARRQRDGQRARQRAVTRSPVTRAARGQRDGQRENSAKRKTGSGQAARSSLSNRRKAPTHRHRKPAQITARKAAVNPSLKTRDEISRVMLSSPQHPTRRRRRRRRASRPRPRTRTASRTRL